MKIRLFLLLFLVSGIFFSFEWRSGGTVRDGAQHVELLKKKKKRKKPKKKKTKKVKTTSKKSPQDSAKLAKKKKKAEKRHDRNLNKLNKQKEKKAKSVTKAQDDRKDYTKCDSSDVVRTSQDTVLLAKYIKIYRSLGGICYIMHLQDMADLKQTSEGFYYVQVKESKDPRAPAAWQTFLYCPIGKPNGTIALLSPQGDTIQMCTYQNEMKNGVMYYIQKGKGVVYKEKYLNDVKVWEKKEDE